MYVLCFLHVKLVYLPAVKGGTLAGLVGTSSASFSIGGT